jgi:hypothetical protein
VNKLHYKDAILDELARDYNVAQFVSFGPDLRQRYARVLGLPPNHHFGSLHEAITALLDRSPDQTVNMRSFEPDQPRSQEFIQNLRTVEEVAEHLARLSASGLTTIINETIDVSDGGVSGVATPQTIEFGPDSTPRVVEEDDVARLPRSLGDRLLKTVYGFVPEVPTGQNLRLEFSIHPKPRGWLRRHTVLWEKEPLATTIIPARPTWPNKFSRFIGDKVYGLLMASAANLKVPRTTVVSRRVAPFVFGDETGELEVWLRTCPAKPTPGVFTTVRGWVDPFRLLRAEDPTNELIASVLSQQSVRPMYSGAIITEADGKLRIEGMIGAGDAYMLHGTMHHLPELVVGKVRQLNDQLSAIFGPVSFEWVFDGTQVWIVQLHVGQSASLGDVIYPGEPAEWIEIPASEDLKRLRELVAHLDRQRTGVLLLGSIGIASHKGEFLRQAQIPSRLSPLGDPAKGLRAHSA